MQLATRLTTAAAAAFTPLPRAGNFYLLLLSSRKFATRVRRSRTTHASVTTEGKSICHPAGHMRAEEEEVGATLSFSSSSSFLAAMCIHLLLSKE